MQACIMSTGCRVWLSGKGCARISNLTSSPFTDFTVNPDSFRDSVRIWEPFGTPSGRRADLNRQGAQALRAQERPNGARIRGGVSASEELAHLAPGSGVGLGPGQGLACPRATGRSRTWAPSLRTRSRPPGALVRRRRRCTARRIPSRGAASTCVAPKSGPSHVLHIRHIR